MGQTRQRRRQNRRTRRAGSPASITFVSMDGESISLPYEPQKTIREYKMRLARELGNYYNICSELTGQCYGANSDQHHYSTLSEAGLMPASPVAGRNYTLLLEPSNGLGGSSPFNLQPQDTIFMKGSTKDNKTHIDTLKLFMAILEDAARAVEQKYLDEPINEALIRSRLGEEEVELELELEAIEEAADTRVRRAIDDTITRIVDTAENFELPGNKASMRGLLNLASNTERDAWRNTLRAYVEIGEEAQLDDAGAAWRWSKYFRSIKKGL